MAAPLSKLPVNFLFGDYLKLASYLLISCTKTVFVFILFLYSLCVCVTLEKCEVLLLFTVPGFLFPL